MRLTWSLRSATWPANRSVSMSLHEEFREKLEQSSLVATVWGFVEKQVTRAMDDLFGPLATLNANDADWQNAFKILKKEGIFGLLDHDGELTRALAAIGLVNTFSTSIEIVRMVGNVLDVEEDVLERAMNLRPLRVISSGKKGQFGRCACLKALMVRPS